MSANRRVICRVRLKEGVLDPQGVTIKHALDQLGYSDVCEVRSGRVFELTFDGSANGDLRLRAEEICRKILANPVIEEFEIMET